jgi:hypothetical protein
MGRHPASIAGAAGDTALNAESAEISEAAEKVLGDLRSLGDGFDVRDSSPATSMYQIDGPDEPGHDKRGKILARPFGQHRFI